ncbi:CLUMA_CG006780, isoform A [Clunio marinus]|uniref:CLUMA_CG006780, isoform A n=1 Tax=Clunio marinus TaxID=568069 RepID=A0A1J1I0X7_9DIPT|nr:CLUMA_CG006780, isoform A [Clunio marinus]
MGIFEESFVCLFLRALRHVKDDPIARELSRCMKNMFSERQTIHSIASCEGFHQSQSELPHDDEDDDSTVPPKVVNTRGKHGYEIGYFTDNFVRLQHWFRLNDLIQCIMNIKFREEKATPVYHATTMSIKFVVLCVAIVFNHPDKETP